MLSCYITCTRPHVATRSKRTAIINQLLVDRAVQIKLPRHFLCFTLWDFSHLCVTLASVPAMPWLLRRSKKEDAPPAPVAAAPATAAPPASHHVGTVPKHRGSTVSAEEMAKVRELMRASAGTGTAEALKQKREKEEADGARKVDHELREQIRREREAKQAAINAINVHIPMIKPQSRRPGCTCTGAQADLTCAPARLRD